MFLAVLLLGTLQPRTFAQEEEQLLEDQEIDLDMDLDLASAPPRPAPPPVVVRKEGDAKLQAICSDLCSRRQLPTQTHPPHVYACSPVVDAYEWIPESHSQRLHDLLDRDFVALKDTADSRGVLSVLDRCPSCIAAADFYAKKFEAGMRQIRGGEHDSAVVTDVLYLAFQLRRDGAIIELTPVVLDEMEPTPHMLRILIQATDSLEAKVALFDRAIAMAETQEERIALMYEKAVVIWRYGRMAQARSVAEEVLELDENHGPALLVVGDYWASLAMRGSIAATSPVWVAVDFYNRAASRDPDRASYARQNAAAYILYFPCRDDAFSEGLRDGQAYTTPQGVRTTVRLRDC
ncbi:MAG: hypothetical protein AAGG50_15780 [Bacteroidota bacterium]